MKFSASIESGLDSVFYDLNKKIFLSYEMDIHSKGLYNEQNYYTSRSGLTACSNLESDDLVEFGVVRTDCKGEQTLRQVGVWDFSEKIFGYVTVKAHVGIACDRVILTDGHRIAFMTLEYDNGYKVANQDLFNKFLANWNQTWQELEEDDNQRFEEDESYSFWNIKTYDFDFYEKGLGSDLEKRRYHCKVYGKSIGFNLLRFIDLRNSKMGYDDLRKYNQVQYSFVKDKLNIYEEGKTGYCIHLNEFSVVDFTGTFKECVEHSGWNYAEMDGTVLIGKRNEFKNIFIAENLETEYELEASIYDDLDKNIERCSIGLKHKVKRSRILKMRDTKSLNECFINLLIDKNQIMTIEDSTEAGNCEYGTIAFANKYFSQEQREVMSCGTEYVHVRNIIEHPQRKEIFQNWDFRNVVLNRV